ncbi:MAG: hypothetical protein IT209_00630 [Armatimonadetes bacterium]|nr:hypothetical protein [Armatimonadota bacterium]
MTPLSSLRLKGYSVRLTSQGLLAISPEPPETLLSKIRSRKADITAELQVEHSEAAKRIDRLQYRLMCSEITPQAAEELMTYLARRTAATTAPKDQHPCQCGETLLWHYRNEDDSLPLICYSCHPPRETDSAWNIKCFEVFAVPLDEKQAA